MVNYLNSETKNLENETALRFDEGKLRFDLLPTEILIELTRAYTIGAEKYTPENWRKGMPWSKCIRAVFSHLLKWLSGQTVDKETGCHHLILVAWNCCTLFMYQLHNLGKDTRHKISIDDNFNWVDNNLQIGLSEEKISELRNKYKEKKNE